MKKLISLLLVICLLTCFVAVPASAQTTTTVEMAQARAVVQKVKSSDIIEQAVEKGTPDAIEWWNWYDNLPLLHEKLIMVHWAYGQRKVLCKLHPSYFCRCFLVCFSNRSSSHEWI